MGGARSERPNPSQWQVPIERVCEALDRRYGSPRHGNPDDPLDELVYIVLSTRTRDSVFRETYRCVKERFPDWDDLTPARLEELETLIASAGLGRLKARQLVGIAEELRDRFGRATLDPLRRMDDAAAERELTSLRGVSAKIAKCVLMYALGRRVLPVDTHVHRLAARLGMQVKRRPDTSQDLIESAVPPELRYGFHVNSVAHGRATCRPRRPKCGECCLSEWCSYYADREVANDVRA